MKLVMLIAAVLIGAAPSIANAQTDNVNATGTVGPTVTAKPDAKNGTRDADAGRYGVRGGVGDPSVGANLTGRAWRSKPASLRQRRTY